MTAVLKLKRPRGGATPSSFRLPGLDEEDFLVGRNGDDCHVFLYVDEHPSFLSRVHAKLRCQTETVLASTLKGEAGQHKTPKRRSSRLKDSLDSADAPADEISRQSSAVTDKCDESPSLLTFDNVLRTWVPSQQPSRASSSVDGGSRRKRRFPKRQEKDEDEQWVEQVYWEVVDDKSVNGVFVNGDRLKDEVWCRLKEGDRIFFGNPQHSFFLEYEFVVYEEGSKEALFHERSSKRGRYKKRKIAAPVQQHYEELRQWLRAKHGSLIFLSPQVANATYKRLKKLVTRPERLEQWVQSFPALKNSVPELHKWLKSSFGPLPDHPPLEHVLSTLNFVPNSGVLSLEMVLAIVDRSIFADSYTVMDAVENHTNWTFQSIAAARDFKAKLGQLVHQMDLIVENRDLFAGIEDANISSLSRRGKSEMSQPSSSSSSSSRDIRAKLSLLADSDVFLPSTEEFSVTSGDDRTQVADEDIARLNDDTDLEGNTVATGSRKRRNSSQQPLMKTSRRRRGEALPSGVNVLTIINSDIAQNVLTFFELSDVFKMRQVCRAFKRTNEKHLKTLKSLRWSPRWEQSELGFMLQSVSNVVSIDASGCYNITDRQVQLIARTTPKIQTLDLSGCSKISTDGVKALADSCTRLESLRLRACKRIASPQATAHLIRLAKNCTTLVRLDLRCCNMGDGALTRLLSHCRNLKSLDIGSTGFAEVSDQVLFALAENKNSQLERLGVMCCRNITDEGVAAVAKGCGKTLKHFTLHCCFELTDKSLANLANHCKQLVSLNVHRCLRLSDDGVERLARGCGATLRSLDVSACNINNEAIIAIAESCPELRVLDVRSCDAITSSAIEKIAENCPLLEQIDLSCCEKLDDDAIYALAKYSKNLTQVEFGKGFTVSDEANKTLSAALPRAAIYF